ncbi:hypothetical protein HY950_03280 [Candidatus Gottesmanbacteria bacterium]|nr:hypothetical protein [Candidatus Gottesmanbacteria bacterium]
MRNAVVVTCNTGVPRGAASDFCKLFLLGNKEHTQGKGDKKEQNGGNHCSFARAFLFWSDWWPPLRPDIRRDFGGQGRRNGWWFGCSGIVRFMNELVHESRFLRRWPLLRPDWGRDFGGQGCGWFRSRRWIRLGRRDWRVGVDRRRRDAACGSGRSQLAGSIINLFLGSVQNVGHASVHRRSAYQRSV